MRAAVAVTGVSVSGDTAGVNYKLSVIVCWWDHSRCRGGGRGGMGAMGICNSSLSGRSLHLHAARCNAALQAVICTLLCRRRARRSSLSSALHALPTLECWSWHAVNSIAVTPPPPPSSCPRPEAPTRQWASSQVRPSNCSNYPFSSGGILLTPPLPHRAPRNHPPLDGSPLPLRALHRRRNHLAPAAPPRIQLPPHLHLRKRPSPGPSKHLLWRKRAKHLSGIPT